MSDAIDPNEYAHRLAAQSPLAAAAFAFGGLVEEVDRERAASENVVRVATRSYPTDDGNPPELITTIHVNCACKLTKFLVGTFATMKDAEACAAQEAAGTGRRYRQCTKSQPLKPEAPAAEEPEAEPTLQAGDRIRCSDGRVRTVTGMSPDVPGWVIVQDKSAWPVHSCEGIDTSRIPEARAAAINAAARMRANADPDSSDWRKAAGEIGEALRYLQEADAEYAYAIWDSRSERVTLELPRTLVAPGDILHHFGARSRVLSTGLTKREEGGFQWWAEVYGVTKKDRESTYRAPWTTGMGIEHAAWDVVTVERVLPIAD